MAVTVYQYPRCSTCRKALSWLDARKIAHGDVDLVAKPPSVPVLRDLWKRSGLPLARFFNTSGESYRAGGFKDRLAAMSDDEALSALAKDGKLVKRPILDTGKAVRVGFREAEWDEALSSRR